MKKDKKVISSRPPKEGEGKSNHPKSERVYPSDHLPHHEIDAFENESENRDKEEKNNKTDF